MESEAEVLEEIGVVVLFVLGGVRERDEDGASVADKEFGGGVGASAGDNEGGVLKEPGSFGGRKPRLDEVAGLKFGDELVAGLFELMKVSVLVDVAALVDKGVFIEDRAEVLLNPEVNGVGTLVATGDVDEGFLMLFDITF